MRLTDLINSNQWLSVKYTLLYLYPDQQGMVDEYQKVFEKLTVTEPVKSDMVIILSVVEPDPEFPEDESYVDVSGIPSLKNPDEITDSYGLEFVKWNEWLGMELAPEALENFSELEIIAHCLYEMTFVHFDEDKIQEEIERLNKISEELKNMSEEERRKNTISLEDLMKEMEDWKKKDTDEDSM